MVVKISDRHHSSFTMLLSYELDVRHNTLFETLFKWIALNSKFSWYICFKFRFNLDCRTLVLTSYYSLRSLNWSAWNKPVYPVWWKCMLLVVTYRQAEPTLWWLIGTTRTSQITKGQRRILNFGPVDSRIEN